MLEVAGLKVFHGPIEAVHGIDLAVGQGTCVSLLGPNGAGKTSTLGAIVGSVRHEGAIRLDGRDLGRMAIEDRFREGIALCPEGRRIFNNLSVHDNLRMGAATRRDAKGVAADIDDWFARFPILGERRDQSAGTLSGGEQQMLAIARALLSRPRILLLDEPSLGLAPLIIRQVFELIAELRRDGMTILLVEQNASAAVEVSDRVYVMANGVIRRAGAAAEFGDGSGLMDELTGVHA
ncbi:branched-chain amino acid ABC transporter, ATP-binding protein [Oceanicola granulosus HTCC2516]|uniref:Branched-chain amino acid ABC transporter, ATP-binding protein n=1 Tax=Oceanicola granulosus (strain ATCC BAA-861 / DSM 15982 / KCTC 12143 / HTCC2516) TaxID=314256 RepID=Q2CEU2_OCEGH|nr:ABC transporter ATP-binding protein [Oceanicola granulosus]EAR51166.1 branched-chain amino acid ABC transporter, ATP-binding protein [Oceanicola granulosus HTCC2516]